MSDHPLAQLDPKALESNSLGTSTSTRMLDKLCMSQGTPSVEYDLYNLISQRMSETKLPVYIPPMAKANLQANDDDLFPLMDKVKEFLVSNRLVMLILGDSGGGKTTFNKHLELELLQSYTPGGRIPLFINLPAIDRPDKDLIAKQLRDYNFSKAQIHELKQHHQFVVICDGYDESQLNTNLHTSNIFNRPNQWDVKLIISCRSQYLGQDYRYWFVPLGDSHYIRPTSEHFQEAAITPFSKEQIQDYVEQYVPLEPRTWTTQDYMDKLTTIPNLMDLVKNPFLLSLTLEVLPLVIEGRQDLSAIKVTRVHLYDTFVDHWLNVNKRRLESNTLSVTERSILDQLLDAGFISMGTEYSTNLATAIFEEQGGIPVVRYIPLKDKNTWRAKFFSHEPRIRLLRESSPLSRTGTLFRFLHLSMQEYFYSRAIFDPLSSHGSYEDLSPQPDPVIPLFLDPRDPLFKRDLTAEPSVIQFLGERVRQYPNFEKHLLGVIEQSKTDHTTAIAAANAITILVRAGVRFNGADLRGIRIPGADISGGQFDCAQLQGADLTRVNLAGSWLRKVDLDGALMDGVRFGELPYLKTEEYVEDCMYSPDGEMLAVVFLNGGLNVYDTTTWTLRRQYPKEGNGLICVAFSPNSQQLAFGVFGGNYQPWDIRLCDITESGNTLVMKGHSDWLESVAFSPCGMQVATLSRDYTRRIMSDHTVRLWSAETGEAHFVLEGHPGSLSRLAYTPDGQRLVSGSEDGGIKVWDPRTGEVVTSWNIGIAEDSSCVKDFSFALSPDGLSAAVFLKGKIQIVSTLTGDPGPALKVVDRVFSITFSPNGQWISGTSEGTTVRVWDISTECLISSFSGHNYRVVTCAFSPSSSQIASFDSDGYVRLWEVDNTLPILDPNGPNTPVEAITYSPDGRHILSCGVFPGNLQWDSLTGTSTPLQLQVDKSGCSMALSPSGEHIATGSSDRTIRLWSRQANAVERSFHGRDSKLSNPTYSPCGRWIVSFRNYTIDYIDQGCAYLWDLHDENLSGAIEISIPQLGYITCHGFTPAGLFALVKGGGSLYLFDPQSQDPGSPVKEMLFDITICSLDCSPNSQELAFGTSKSTICLWDLQSNKSAINTLEGHKGRVTSIAYSPCGKWILSGSHDRTVRIWGLRKGELDSRSCLTVVNAGNDIIKSASWNPVAPKEFVTGSKDGSLRVWRMSTLDNGGDVSVQMLWGNNVGILSASDLSFKGAISLSPIYKKLLVQRGAIDNSAASE